MAKPMTVPFLLNLLGHLKFIAMEALTHLGLFNPAEEADSAEQTTNYVLVMDWASPTLVPVHILMASIKKRLPVVEYSNFLQRLGMHEDEDMGCSICLECIERRHEIRELSNCCHVFHRECLDNWVDEGHVTCPLCRSMLLPLPAKGETTHIHG